MKFISLLSLLISTFYISAQSATLGNYLEFNGKSITVDGDFIKVADHASLDIDATQSLTIQFWINPKKLDETNGTHQALVSKKTASGSGFGVYWHVTASGGRFQFSVEEVPSNGGTTKTLSSDYISNVQTLGWMHITAILKRNTLPVHDSLLFYFDGEFSKKTFATDIEDLSNFQDLYLMNYPGNSTDLCGGGSLDEVRIWNVALTEKQIQRLYAEPIQEGLLGKVQGKRTGKYTLLNWSNLMGYWDFEDPTSGFVVTDKSLNSNNGTFNQGNTACTSSGCGPDFVFPVGSPVTYASKETFETAQSGDWSDPTTWEGGTVPNNENAIVTILDGHTVLLDGNYICQSFTVANGGTFVSDADAASILRITKYFDIDGYLDFKTQGNILFDQVGDHKIFGEGKLDFFDFELYQNSQIQIETEPGSPVNIYGVLVHGDGRIRTGDNVVLKVNKNNIDRPYGLINPVGVGTPDIVGTIKMDKVLSSTDSSWRQLCMPFTGTLANFTGMPIVDNTGVLEEQNVFYWDNAQNGATGFNVGWTTANLSEDQTKAYAVFLGNPFYSFLDTITFEGNYNWGNKDYTLTYFNDPGNGILSGQPGYENGVGWNFMPNPYASLLDVQQIITDNPLAYKNIHIWDANNKQYMAFTANIGDNIIPYNNQGTNSAELTGAAIEPMQGFWVKTEAGEDGTIFTIQDAWRSTNFSLNPYPSLKKSNQLQINILSVVDSSWDAALIQFDVSATVHFNGKTDVYKKLSDANVPSLFVLKDQRFLQIAQLPETQKKVPLFFKPQTGNRNGNYILDLSNLELASHYQVFLEDKAFGNLHNLSQGQYAFNAKDFLDPHRFNLILSTRTLSSDQLNNHVLIYQNHQYIVLSSIQNLGQCKVTIHTIEGKKLYSKSLEITEDSKIPTPNYRGVCLITIEHKDGIETQKLLLNN